MPPFRRVEAARAGPLALGILVPPGPRTQVILRPRALEWDLLPSADENGAFAHFAREEAAAVARRVFQALEQAAIEGMDRLQTLPNSKGGFHVATAAGGFFWLVCLRLPGKPYQPQVFATAAEAQQAVNQLRPYVCPAADATQEYYFNTQNFSR